jgi:hypothetical protein
MVVALGDGPLHLIQTQLEEALRLRLPSGRQQLTIGLSFDPLRATSPSMVQQLQVHLQANFFQQNLEQIFIHPLLFHHAYNDWRLVVVVVLQFDNFVSD